MLFGGGGVAGAGGARDDAFLSERERVGLLRGMVMVAMRGAEGSEKTVAVAERRLVHAICRAGPKGGRKGGWMGGAEARAGERGLGGQSGEGM